MTDQKAEPAKGPTGRVIWINGPFGIGKTTVARQLVVNEPNAALFDPEPLARLVRDATPRNRRPDDYQDAPLWRHLTVEALVGFAQTTDVFVPMTVIDERHFLEIIGGLRTAAIDVRHFALTASPSTVRKRLLKRQVTRLHHPRSTAWALARVDHCCAVLADEMFGEQVDTEHQSVKAVAAIISARLEPRGAR